MMTDQDGLQSPPIHKKQVFISYSTKDRELALRLFEDLNAQLNPEGVTVWMDKHGLKVGSPNWEIDIRAAIRDSYTVVYVASPDALNSPYVGGELSISEAYKLKIYPIWVRGELWQDCVPLRLIQTQYADARMEPGEAFPGRKYGDAINQLVSQLLGKESTARIPDKEEFQAALASHITPTPDARPNPYKGLEAFSEEDASYFFGRDAFVAELIQALKIQLQEKKPRFLAVIGPSGSGKSSVVQAGLIPALRTSDKLPGSKQWVYLNPIKPGGTPLTELANELRRALNAQLRQDRSVTNLKQDLYDDSRGLSRVAKDFKSPVVIYIDQFEELFTQTTDEAERRQFIDLLVKAAGETDSDSQVIIIVTMRAAFLEKVMTYRDLTLNRQMTLGVLFKDSLHTHSLYPMTMPELRDAIALPARKSGLQMDDKDRLIGDLAFEMYRQPGALPLLQFLLFRLVEQNPGYLTREAYDRSDGVQDALDGYAEGVFQALPSESHRQLARDLFLRLITLDEMDQEASRQRVTVASLALEGKQPGQTLHEVVAAFVDARLLTQGEMSDQPTVEISHEILIHKWKRLQKWLEDNREFIIFQRALRQDVKGWHDGGRSPSYLYTGLKLDKALDWFSKGYRMSQDEEQFLNAARQYRRTNRLRLGAVILAALILVFAAMSIFSSQRGQNQRQAEIILSQRLAVSSQQELSNGRVETALALSWQANDTSQPPVLAQNALYSAAYSPQMTRTFDQQHTGDIRALAFSPDGKTAVSGGKDGQLFLFDLATGSVLQSMHDTDAPPAAVVRGAAFTSDGLSILVGSSDGVVTQWSAADGKLTKHFQKVHTDAVLALAISPDDSMALTGSADGSAILWDIKTGEVIRLWRGDSGAVRTVAFSPDGKVALAAVDDTQVVVWDIASGTEINRFTAHKRLVLSAAFSPNFVPGGKYAISVSDDKALFYWNVETGDIVRLFQSPSNRVNQLAFSRDGSRVFGALANGRLAVWDTGTGHILYELTGKNQPDDHVVGLWTLAVSLDGHFALVGDSDGSVALWNITNEPQLARLVGHKDQVWAVAMSSDGHRAISGSLDGSVIYWNLDDGSPIQKIQPSDIATRRVWSVALSPNGSTALIGMDDGELYIWKVGTDKAVHMDGHSNPNDPNTGVFALAFSPDGKTFLSGSDDKTAILWSMESLSLLCRFTAHSNVINAVAFNPDRSKALTASADGTIILWNTQNCDTNTSSGSIIHHFQQSETGSSDIRDVSFSPDGKTFLSGSQDGRLTLWDANTFEALNRSFNRFAQESKRGWGVAISPDNKTALSAAADNAIAYWDLSTGELIDSFRGHTDGVMRIMFSGDGKKAISASLDGTVIVWRVDNLDDVKNWIKANRQVASLDCRTRQQYDIPPLPCTV
jgi:WD40 repeat protein